MIDPTPGDILRTVEHTLATVIVPALHGTTERSAAATILHLLRHAALRGEQDGQVLYDERAALRPVLQQAHDYFDGLGLQQDAADVQTALDLRLPPDRYPSVQLLAAILGQSQAALERALERLIAMRPDHGATPAYAALRHAIRRFMAAQIRREADLVHPAFDGRGPRR